MDILLTTFSLPRNEVTYYEAKVVNATDVGGSG